MRKWTRRTTAVSAVLVACAASAGAASAFSVTPTLGLGNLTLASTTLAVNQTLLPGPLLSALPNPVQSLLNLNLGICSTVAGALPIGLQTASDVQTVPSFSGVLATGVAFARFSPDFHAAASVNWGAGLPEPALVTFTGANTVQISTAHPHLFLHTGSFDVVIDYEVSDPVAEVGCSTHKHFTVVAPIPGD